MRHSRGASTRIPVCRRIRRAGSYLHRTRQRLTAPGAGRMRAAVRWIMMTFERLESLQQRLRRHPGRRTLSAPGRALEASGGQRDSRSGRSSRAFLLYRSGCQPLAWQCSGNGDLPCAHAVNVVWLVGLLRMSLDIISAPAANVALPLGFDEMIHLSYTVRRLRSRSQGTWAVWKDALTHLWKPIFASMLIVASGFSLFLLSAFPPTQRLGVLVCAGAILTDLVVLLVLPAIIGWRDRGERVVNP